MKTSLQHPALRLLRVGAAGLMLALGPASAAWANQPYESPEQAMAAFGDAVAGNDDAALQRLLGADFRKIVPPLGAELRSLFLAAWARSHAIRRDGDKRALVEVGADGWTLPIPIVKAARGWEFDTRAGAEEMRIRRIGRNELAAIQTLLAIHDAQLEYVALNPDKDAVRAYASKLTSSPGKHDGLYWPTREGEPLSPIGPALAAAAGRSTSATGYHGYHFELLTSQGAHAPGGKLDYVVKGKLFGGYAIVAWPVRYGETGVKSFMISHDTQVYERDLGPDSAAKAAAVTSFDPGPGWEKVSP